jgi:Tol biopolymer transport system component
LFRRAPALLVFCTAGVDYSFIGGDIWVMGPLGGSARRIAESGNFPSWSPDGTAIIYTLGTSWFQRKMYRVSAQGGEPQEIPYYIQER